MDDLSSPWRLYFACGARCGASARRQVSVRSDGGDDGVRQLVCNGRHQRQWPRRMGCLPSSVCSRSMM
jgi:hypothetical protein